MEFTIRLADKSIGISCLYDEAYKLCHDYLTETAPDFSVTVTPDDTERERIRSLREAVTEGIPPVEYPRPYLETLAVYRKIATEMLAYDKFLMHGAVVAVGDKAWLFTAPSGTGKTTHIRLWLEHIEGSYVVNGDKPLLRIGDDVTVYGTPWAGKEGMQKNTGVKLCGIVFLERSAGNSIGRVPFSEVYPIMVQHSYRPDNKPALEQTLHLIMELGRRIPLYRLKCNMLPEAALTAYEMLHEDYN